MKELTVRRNDAGQRLDRFVGKAVPLLPETLLQKYIRIKRIKLNGKGAKRDTRLSEGDVLSLYINDEFFEKPREENAYLKVGKPRINIVYEDENIILADKKPGVLCHSAGAWDYNTLIANIQAYLAQKGEWDPKGPVQPHRPKHRRHSHRGEKCRGAENIKRQDPRQGDRKILSLRRAGKAEAAARQTGELSVQGRSKKSGLCQKSSGARRKDSRYGVQAH